MRVEITRHQSGSTTIQFDGVDVSKDLRAVHVDIDSNLPMKVVAEYACHEQARIDGEADVIHVCPKGGRAK